MGFLLDKFEKLIVEHGSAVVRGDLIALLREQLQIAEKRMATLETENSTLKADKRALETEIAKLKPQTKPLTHDDLEETDITILKLIAIAQNQP